MARNQKRSDRQRRQKRRVSDGLAQRVEGESYDYRRRPK